MIVLTFLLCLVVIHNTYAGFICPNSCNGNGRCDAENLCRCYSGWEGPDCSYRSCPRGRSWADKPRADLDAHRPAECSDRGLCDYDTGSCRCFTGYGGLGCERSSLKCGKYGTEVNMHQLYEEFTITAAGSFVNPYVNYIEWDANALTTCKCDPGFTGADCSMSKCMRVKCVSML